MIAIGLVGLISVIVWQANVWLPRFSAGEPTYFAQRILFVLATTIELPIVPKLNFFIKLPATFPPTAPLMRLMMRGSILSILILLIVLLF